MVSTSLRNSGSLKFQCSVEPLCRTLFNLNATEPSFVTPLVTISCKNGCFEKGLYSDILLRQTMTYIYGSSNTEALAWLSKLPHQSILTWQTLTVVFVHLGIKLENQGRVFSCGISCFLSNNTRILVFSEAFFTVDCIFTAHRLISTL